MPIQPDFVLYNRDGRLIAVAEVKNQRGTSEDWAAQFRRNLLAHGGFQNSELFLLVTPDRVYLWKNAGTEPALVPPTYTADGHPFFEPYFCRAGLDPQKIGGHAFELVAMSWLSDLTRAQGIPAEPAEQAWLVDSGLLGAIQDGWIDFEDAA